MNALTIKRFIELLRTSSKPTTLRAASLVDTLFRFVLDEDFTRAVADISPEVPGYTDIARRVCNDKGWALGECCPFCGCRAIDWGKLRRCATDGCAVFGYEMRSEDEIFVFHDNGRTAFCRQEGAFC